MRRRRSPRPLTGEAPPDANASRARPREFVSFDGREGYDPCGVYGVEPTLIGHSEPVFPGPPDLATTTDTAEAGRRWIRADGSQPARCVSDQRPRQLALCAAPGG